MQQRFLLISTVICLAMAFGLATLGYAQTAENRPPEVDAAPQLDSLISRLVAVELRNGRSYSAAKLLRVFTEKTSSKPIKVRIQQGDGRTRTLSLSAVRLITHQGKIVYQAPASATDKPSRREQAIRQAEKQHQQWLARLEARGLKPWSKLTKKEHQQAIDAHKKRYREVAKLLPSLQLVETEHFLFCTNIPPQQVGVFVASLDRMYAWMKSTYGIRDDQTVWRGKASVFAFVHEEEFVAFERQFMDNNPQPGTGGLCHTDNERNVCIAVHQGTSADYFGVVLVHETSHGFIHCYKTPVRVPSWVNEGMAEVIAGLMVPTSKGVQSKEKQFLQALQSVPEPHLGDEFFAVDQNIPFDRYGGATSMTRFLLQSDQQKYVRFIDLLKEGLPWEEALSASFNATKEQLVTSYGQWLGVPQLQP